MSQEEDPELAIIRARKMKQLKEKAALIEKIKESKSDVKKVDDKELLLKYLYDRGDEVLELAESQYPIQAKLVVNRIVELIKSGDIVSLISGGKLLKIFLPVGLRKRFDIIIQI